MLGSLFTWLGSAAFASAAVAFAFGVIALVIGALFNSHLNRRRDERLRLNEANAIAAALYGEILLLRMQIAWAGTVVARTVIASGRKRLELNYEALKTIPLGDPHFYKELASKIGMLPAGHVIAITEFYRDYESVRRWLPLMIDEPDRDFSYNRLSLLNPARDAMLKVRPTLRSIEQWVGMSQPAPDPDITEMMLAIDMLQDERD